MGGYRIIDNSVRVLSIKKAKKIDKNYKLKIKIDYLERKIIKDNAAISEERYGCI